LENVPHASPSKLARLDSYLMEPAGIYGASGAGVDVLFHEIANELMRYCEGALYPHREVRSRIRLLNNDNFAIESRHMHPKIVQDPDIDDQ
jgi:hypothetical protein